LKQSDYRLKRQEQLEVMESCQVKPGFLLARQLDWALAALESKNKFTLLNFISFIKSL
jgi:hypothetical protein